MEHLNAINPGLDICGSIKIVDIHAADKTADTGHTASTKCNY